MLIKSFRSSDVSSSEITPESTWLSRRKLLAFVGSGLASSMLLPARGMANSKEIAHPWLGDLMSKRERGKYQVDDELTPVEIVTGYNNFYEFGTDKTDPRDKAKHFKVDPWHVEVTGKAEVTGRFTLEDVIKPHQLEERIYRFRCVEAWSMVVPWVGVPLRSVIKQFKPLSSAKYVRFETLYDPEQMPGQRSYFASIDYPYVEGLRIDEASHDLAFLAVGVYGQRLPPQNGAPLRLVVPWKYGFKSIKSIVRMEFTDQRPVTTWEKSNSREYGFYANVNPEVNHPRWSQARERRLPNSLFNPRYIPTRMFNGYAEEVAHLYAGMDLSRYY